MSTIITGPKATRNVVLVDHHSTQKGTNNTQRVLSAPF